MAKTEFVAITFAGSLRVNTTGADGFIYVSLDGTALDTYTRKLWLRPAATAANIATICRSFKLSLSSGSHTIKLTALVGGASAGNIYGASWTAIIASA